MRYPYDDTYERVLKVNDITVTSDAPDDVETSNEGDDYIIRIGDEDRTVTGKHTYTISYTVRGGINDFPDHVELCWNAIGADWGVPIGHSRVGVTMPGQVTDARASPDRKTPSSPATAPQSRGDGQPSQRQLASVRGAHRRRRYASGLAAAGRSQPILDEKFAITRAFAVTPATGSGFIALLLLGLAGVVTLVWQRGRDRVWPGMTPGLDPPDGMTMEEEPDRCSPHPRARWSSSLPATSAPDR